MIWYGQKQTHNWHGIWGKKWAADQKGWLISWECRILGGRGQNPTSAAAAEPSSICQNFLSDPDKHQVHVYVRVGSETCVTLADENNKFPTDEANM